MRWLLAWTRYCCRPCASSHYHEENRDDLCTFSTFRAKHESYLLRFPAEGVKKKDTGSVNMPAKKPKYRQSPLPGDGLRLFYLKLNLYPPESPPVVWLQLAAHRPGATAKSGFPFRRLSRMARDCSAQPALTFSRFIGWDELLQAPGYTSAYRVSAICGPGTRAASRHGKYLIYRGRLSN
jgi:hypothetical protein